MSTGSVKLLGSTVSHQHSAIGAPMQELGKTPPKPQPVAPPAVKEEAPPQDTVSDLASAVEKFGPRVSAVGAMVLGGEQPSSGLMTAIYDFRQAVREALGSTLKDRGQLDFKWNADLLAKDYAVLKQYCAKIPAERKQALFSSMVAVENALGPTGAPTASAPSREKIALRLKTAQELFAKAGQGLKKAGPDAAPALLETQAKSALAQLRAALELFQLDKGGCPAALSALVPDYLPEIPTVTAAGGKKSAGVKVISEDTFADPLDAVTGAGGWLYFADKTSPVYCKALINSRRKSSSGKAWYKY